VFLNSSAGDICPINLAKSHNDARLNKRTDPMLITIRMVLPSWHSKIQIPLGKCRFPVQPIMLVLGHYYLYTTRIHVIKIHNSHLPV